MRRVFITTKAKAAAILRLARAESLFMGGGTIPVDLSAQNFPSQYSEDVDLIGREIPEVYAKHIISAWTEKRKDKDGGYQVIRYYSMG